MATIVYGPEGRIVPFLDSSITRHYLSPAGIPDQSGKIIAEYVWIGGKGSDLRSKARTLDKKPKKPEDLPHWNYDGSSTGQAPGNDSEVYLIPRAIYRWAGSRLYCRMATLLQLQGAACLSYRLAATGAATWCCSWQPNSACMACEPGQHCTVS